MLELGFIAGSIALLYFWLLGHWFARVLVFLGLLVCAAFTGLFVSSRGDAVNAGVAVFIVGVVVAWLLASIPVIYWRKRLGII